MLRRTPARAALAPSELRCRGAWHCAPIAERGAVELAPFGSAHVESGWGRAPGGVAPYSHSGCQSSTRLAKLEAKTRSRSAGSLLPSGRARACCMPRRPWSHYCQSPANAPSVAKNSGKNGATGNIARGCIDGAEEPVLCVQTSERSAKQRAMIAATVLAQPRADGFAPYASSRRGFPDQRRELVFRRSTFDVRNSDFASRHSIQFITLHPLHTFRFRQLRTLALGS